jgi:hypothetical protein
MATYYKYAERSADSQINWAEVGKNMSDMLLEENRIREEKKASIDAASRKYGEVLANAPLGEYEPARTAALKFADDAANYMRIQDQLLKSGQLKLKDYTINRQNLLDGTNNAFTSLKEFQDTYAQKMERARTNKSALYELRKMEQVQGFGNWRESSFYINPTNGAVNIAMMTEKDVNGKKVFTMDDKPEKFATVNYVRDLIQGEWNRYNYNEAADAFVNGLGKQIDAVQSAYAELKKQGVVTSINDIRTKKEIDPVTNQILFSIDMAEDQAITSALANDFDRASLLTDSKKTAPNGKLYDFTQDATKAAANPNLILEVIDPNTGRSTLKFSDQQVKDSNEFLKTEFRRRYDYEKKIDVGGQLQPLPQPRERSPYEIANQKEIADARNFARNLADALTAKNPVAVGNAVKYLANKSGKSVVKSGSKFTVSNTDGSNATTFDLNGDPTKLPSAMVSAFGVQLPEDKISEFAVQFIGKNPLERTVNASGFNPKPAKTNPIQAYNDQVDNLIGKNPTAWKKADSEDFASELNKVANKFGYTVNTSWGTNSVYLEDKDGKKSPTFKVSKTSQKENGATIRRIADWMKSDLEGASPEEKEANAASKLQTLGVTKPGGVGAKYN